MFQNTKIVLSSSLGFSVWSISMILLGFSWYTFSDIAYVTANYNSFFAYYDMILSFFVTIFFPLFLSTVVYKIHFFGKLKNSNTLQGSGFFGVVGGLVSTMIAGATCCGVSLISVLGLTSVISFLEFLPFHGIEIKTLGIILLVFAWYKEICSIHLCKISSRKS